MPKFGMLSTRLWFATALTTAFVGFSPSGIGPVVKAQQPATQPTAPKPAEPATQAANEAVLRELPFANREDFEAAQRGFIGTIPGGRVGPEQRPVWDMERYAFEQGNAPPTVNPSLWRQAQLNNFHGLFQVTDRVYQVRGLDLANMTIVEGDTGIIITDALLSAEGAKAGLELYYQYRPRKPILAVIFSHSHVDHYGGIKGLITEEDVRQGQVKLIAPDHFMEEVVSENVIAGTAMSRRSQYQFGPFVPVGERGQVDAGLGKTTPRGSVSLMQPNDLIKDSYETRKIDGVEIEFHLVPASEAPSEMIMYYPQFRLLNMAEDATRTLHNIYTIRGAQVRDARIWSRYIGEALERYGNRTDFLVAQHHWPTFGQAKIVSYLAKQRDLYKFIHDQSVRLMSQGYKPAEIAEEIKLPPSLANEWSARDYYGTVSHNSKAVYQFYLGWYDANPANLNPLPPVQSARKSVAYMGGADAVLKRAREDLKAGEYRWVASVTSQVVFADPGNKEARELNADALEQLGYQAEAGTWRNAYLMGAWELRNGTTKLPPPRSPSDLLKASSPDMQLDYLAVRLDPKKAEARKIVLNISFKDTGQTFRLNLENSAMTNMSGKAPNADANLSLTRATLDEVVAKQRTILEAIKAGDVTVEGDAQKFMELMSMLDEFTIDFPVIEPRR